MEQVFLACFLFGALFTAASFVLGVAGDIVHIGGGNAEIGHHGAGHDGAAAGHHGGHDLTGPQGHTTGTAHATGGEHGHGPRLGLPLLNLTTILTFLTWFGAAGYVLLKAAGMPAAVAVAAAASAGGIGMLLMALFLRKVRAGERVMNPRDYRLEGTLARVTVSIPGTGAGEIVYSKAGTRRSEAARSLTGRPIPRNTEVVVVAYERGVAAVQPYEEFVGAGRAPRAGSERGTGDG